MGQRPQGGGKTGAGREAWGIPYVSSRHVYVQKNTLANSYVEIELPHCRAALPFSTFHYRPDQEHFLPPGADEIVHIADSDRNLYLTVEIIDARLELMSGILKVIIGEMASVKGFMIGEGGGPGEISHPKGTRCSSVFASLTNMGRLRYNGNDDLGGYLHCGKRVIPLRPDQSFYFCEQRQWRGTRGSQTVREVRLDIETLLARWIS